MRSSPLLDGVEYRDGAAVLTFRETADGLSSGDGKPLSGFSVAGEDRRFHPATATVNPDGGRRDRPFGGGAVSGRPCVTDGLTLRGKRTWSTARGYPRRLSAPTNGRCRPTTICRRRTDDSGSWRYGPGASVFQAIFLSLAASSNSMRSPWGRVSGFRSAKRSFRSWAGGSASSPCRTKVPPSGLHCLSVPSAKRFITVCTGKLFVPLGKRYGFLQIKSEPGKTRFRSRMIAEARSRSRAMRVCLQPLIVCRIRFRRGCNLRRDYSRRCFFRFSAGRCSHR